MSEDGGSLCGPLSLEFCHFLLPEKVSSLLGYQVMAEEKGRTHKTDFTSGLLLQPLEFNDSSRQ